MKFIHLIYFSYPIILPSTLISTSLDIYCYHFNPIITLSTHYLFTSFACLRTRVIFLTFLRCLCITWILSLTLLVLIVHYPTRLHLFQSYLHEVVYIGKQFFMQHHALTNPFFFIFVSFYTNAQKMSLTPPPTIFVIPPPSLIYLPLILSVPSPFPTLLPTLYM